MTATLSWASAPLRELCEFHNGLWKGKKRPFETATVIRNTNFTLGGRIDLTDVAILEVEARQLVKRRLQKNDIIIEKSGGGPKQPVGRVVLFDLDSDEKYSFSNFTSAIRVARPGKVDPVYLHRVLYWWYVSGRTEPLQSHSTGIRNLDFNAYKELEVPLPPLEEQKRIVAVLDQAFAALDRARAHAEANLADAQVLFVTFVTSEFSKRNEWQSEELGSRVNFVDYRGKTPPKSERGTRLITAKNVRMGFVKEDPREFVPEDAYKGWMTRGIPKVGDVLFTTEAPLANVAQLETKERVVIGQRLITMQTNPAEIDSSFLKWSLISSQMQSDIHSQGTGATVLGIKASLLKKILLHLPKSIELQKQIASDCEAAFAAKIQLEKRYSAKLADLANLRQSLLQKAFSGQLT